MTITIEKLPSGYLPHPWRGAMQLDPAAHLAGRGSAYPQIRLRRGFGALPARSDPSGRKGEGGPTEDV